MIRLHKVSKKFKLYHRPLDRMRELLHLGSRHEEFWALKDISLSVPPGRTMGVIGANGAGKSTLLKLITGTLLPTRGEIEVEGRVAALLELGTGFHPEFTGRQNIYVNGQLLGLTPAEIAGLEEEIIDFSELGPFIDQPIRTYSSGMVMRLGFSVAAAVRPEVLIVDEALSVGDARFSQKCIKRIRRFRNDGATILFVSHDPAAVSTLCDEAVLLHLGEIRSMGSPKEILDEYNALLASEGEGNVEMRVSWVRDETKTAAGAVPRRSGTFEAVIGKIELCNSDGVPSEIFTPGEEMLLRVRIHFFTPVISPTVGFLIRDRLGLSLYGTNTVLQGVGLGEFEPGEAAELEVALPLRLGYGDYSLSVAVHEDETHLERCFEWTDDAAVFSVREVEKSNFAGFIMMEPSITARRPESDFHQLATALESVFSDLPDPLSLEVQTPSPFVEGFRSPAMPDSHQMRPCAPISRFAFRPENSMLGIALSAPQGSAKITLIGFGQLGACDFPEGEGRLMVELPEVAVQKPGLYELHFDAAQDTPIQVMEIASFASPPENTQWPTRILKKSSLISNG